MDSWKEELFLRIREDREREGLSIRALAQKFRVGRDLVRQALADPHPPPRKTPMRRAPVLGPYHAVIDQWLREDVTAPPKQRHTATRIADRLAREYGAPMSYSNIADYVARRRPQILVELGARPGALPGFVERAHAPGADAEVDFGELWVVLEGEMTKCYLFALRLCYSGRAIHKAYSTMSLESFLDGHAYALRALGGVPTGVVRYDNLKVAVQKVIFGSREREETERWSAFHENFGFTPWYCLPGVQGAHEKGGIEGQIGYFRRNYLSPVPCAGSLAELNERIRAFEHEELSRHVGADPQPIGARFALERTQLGPLPADRFDTRLLLTPTVDRYSMITVRQVRYSVPARFIGMQVKVMLGAVDVEVYYAAALVARHPRRPTRGRESVQLDHYLEILLAKPGALPGSKALAQARENGSFTPAHQRLWDTARAAHGEAEGTRILIDVLLLHRHTNPADVAAGLAAAGAIGSTSPELIAMEARRHAAAAGRSPTVTAHLGALAPPGPAPQRAPRRSQLPADTRPLPRLDVYDQLLRHPTST